MVRRWMPFLSPSRQCQGTEGVTYILRDIIIRCALCDEQPRAMPVSSPASIVDVYQWRTFAMEWTIAATCQMKGIGTHDALVCHLKQKFY